jgi:hypothetical protein
MTRGLAGTRDVGGPIAVAAIGSGLVLLAAPHLPIGSMVAQDLVAIALAVGGALAALHVSSRALLPGKAAWPLVLGSVAVLVVLYAIQPGRVGVPFQVGALLLGGRVIGGAIGERVEHPGHVLPATIVAAAADCASVLSPEGITNAVAQNERALATFALAAAIPGTEAITFVLGIGDLIVIALVLSVARKFDVSRARVTFACALALVVAFVASALLAAPVPALLPIAIVVNLLVPPFRRLRQKDRSVAIAALVVAVGVVVVVLLRR